MIKLKKYAGSAAASSLVVLGYESEGPAAPPFSTKSSAAKPSIHIAFAEACHPVKILAFWPDAESLSVGARSVA